MNAPLDILTDIELTRYSRQISIKAIDIEGQEKIKQARVLILGVGGLGCSASQYLAVAGVGHITIVDFDTVELSNLQRQVLHHDKDIGKAKVESAFEALKQLNPNISIKSINQKLSNEQLSELVSDHQLVIDCSDNIAVRQQLNLSCYQHKVPLVSAAAIRMEGLVTVFGYRSGSPCYQCFSLLFGEQQLSCVESGILAPVIGVIGSLQAVEAIKMICGIGTPLIGRVLMFDAMSMEMREMKLKPHNMCAIEHG
ncbi:molybdopterin-synthase adenylyltransferase MoeB [Parashewanella spongiae]|uniref:Molybdopterin-synthase adenylyltransferase n=1 Tax=Parashewanella spongiae TaxID=342950 RepID=A0A3A6T6I6_9GAMM|nr:molybdopterin-synthase adenylyltransferase MoeB [Parashewanella spongiae]MCL1079859.1 molybdopterin-synthase adenylyltransferase MoeB [Parashewanella spongiae]RJY06768.1 molybdopterin-synthase adenylyltransferase MoeB [Parashewanella spongiae]